MIGKRPERNNAPCRWQKLLQHPSFFQWPQCTKPGRPSPQTLSGLGPGRQERPRWRTTARGARGIPRARGPPGLRSELSNSHTLGAISLHLVPLLVQLPMCPRPPSRGAAAALALPAGPVFSPFLPKSRVPQEAVRAGHPSASCRLRRALPLAPPSPPPLRWGYRLMKRSFSSVICFVFLQSSDK